MGSTDGFLSWEQTSLRGNKKANPSFREFTIARIHSHTTITTLDQVDRLQGFHSLTGLVFTPPDWGCRITIFLDCHLLLGLYLLHFGFFCLFPRCLHTRIPSDCFPTFSDTNVDHPPTPLLSHCCSDSTRIKQGTDCSFVPISAVEIFVSS